MTLITRIRTETAVYVASDCQVNDGQGYIKTGQIVCKSVAISSLNILLGISGIIRLLDGKLVLDEIANDLVKSACETISEMKVAIDRTLSSFEELDNEDWHVVLFISTSSKDSSDSYTYIATRTSKQLYPPICLEKQINQRFLRRCFNPIWTSWVYDDIWHTPGWRQHFDLTKWTNAVDFNFNYRHIIAGREVDNDDDWHIVTKPYTLLYFQFLLSTFEYDKIELLTDADWITILKEFYHKASIIHEKIFDRERDRSVPLHTVGKCNHILKLDTNGQKSSVLYCADPCC